jgi:tRNA threonylcarbamoyladenosine biosynthesis protein TsaE|tara:strand:+ start:734 stop:1141 length:408 start_codon:yes stop_codon:yes gene_type:complete
LNSAVKEEDLDKFLDDYLKGIILPKIIGLSGPLGAGKTTIAKKIIKFFGCNDVVTSPTFNIVKNYEVGDIKIFHVDLYRLSSWSEFIDLDLPLSKENTLVLIEWASLMTDSYIPNMDLIKIEIVDYDTRKISINV